MAENSPIMATDTFSPTIHSDIFHELKCILCDGYLSVGPIHVQSDGTNICGRCELPRDKTISPNILLEKVLKHYEFPCRFKSHGCVEKIIFGQTLHEQECLYRPHTCVSLLSGNCTWTGQIKDMPQHFIDHHSSQILENSSVTINIEEIKQENFIHRLNGVVYLIQIDYNNRNREMYYSCLYYSSNSYINAFYQLTLVSGMDSNAMFKIPKSQMFDSNADVSRKCLPLHIYLPALDNPNEIIICFDISTESNQQQSICDINSDLAETIKCCKCLVWMTPPIFELSSNKYCSECCDEKATEVTDIKFLKMIKTLEYPCRWLDCRFVGDYSNIREHEKICEMRLHICNCFTCWDALKLQDVKTHYESKHRYICANLHFFSQYCRGSTKFFDK